MQPSENTVEETLQIRVVYRQQSTDSTASSQKAFENTVGLIDTPRFVVLACLPDPHGGHARTYVVDRDRRALCFTGFSWGYLGTGPNGLKWLFSQIAFDVDAMKLPSHGKC